MKRKTEKNTVTTVIFIIILTLLIVYSLFVIFSLGWGVLTSLKSWRDFEGKFPGAVKNYLGFPNLDASLVSPSGKVIGHSRKEFFQLYNYKTIIDNFLMKKSTEYYVSGALEKTATLPRYGSATPKRARRSSIFLSIPCCIPSAGRG